MRASSLVAPLTTLVVAGATLVAAGFVRPAQPVERPVAMVPPVRSLSCAFPGALGTVHTTQAEGVAVTTPSGAAVEDPFGTERVTGPVLLTRTGEGHFAAAVLSKAGDAMSWTECGAPATRGTVMLPIATDTELLLVNTDQVDAVVSITLHGPSGRITSAGLEGVVVPRRQSVRVPISVHVPTATAVAATFVATQGRVRASANLTRGGREQMAPSQARNTLAFAGVPASTKVRLVLFNPGRETVDVVVSALGVRGRFTAEGGEVSIDPGVTVELDLTDPLNGESVGLLVEGSGPIAGAVDVTAGADRVWLAPQDPGTELRDVVPDGQLQLVNTGESLAQVTVEDTRRASTRHQVPAGGTATVAVPAGVVRITSDTPIAAGVLVTGKGLASTRVRAVQNTTRPEPGMLDPQLGQT